jgi:CxxC motif-containing protein (DUF1111 family)
MGISVFWLKCGLILSFLLPACSEEPQKLTIVGEDGVDLPLRLATVEQRRQFKDGDALFGLPFRAADGLGPLFIRGNCESCHQEGLRGPGIVQKMTLLQADGITPASSPMLMGNTVRGQIVPPALTPLLLPADGWAAGNQIKVTTRVPNPVLGRGYIEAIPDSEIERLEEAQARRDDGISGRINRVSYRSVASTDPTFHDFTLGQANLIGRFGHKARQPTLDDFTADALLGDMGLTSPQRPTELPNPDGLMDDERPGIDVETDVVTRIANYIRLVEIPMRDLTKDTGRARALFEEVRCAACHVPTLPTRPDYPIPQLAGIQAPVYTDLLLHAMGRDMADGLTDENAQADEWRTAPLIGLRFLTSYLHDGRALSIEDAILMHDGPGSEAADSVARFRALSAADRTTLIEFVQSL